MPTVIYLKITIADDGATTTETVKPEELGITFVSLRKADFYDIPLPNLDIDVPGAESKPHYINPLLRGHLKTIGDLVEAIKANPPYWWMHYHAFGPKRAGCIEEALVKNGYIDEEFHCHMRY